MNRIKGVVVGGVLAALLLAACGGGGGGGGNAAANVKVPSGGFANDAALPSVKAWFSEHTAAISALGARPDFTPLTGRVNFSLFSHNCDIFEDSYIVANQLPAIPDSGAETLWKQGLSDFKAAISDCQGGVVHRSVPLLKDSNAQLAAGGDVMSKLIFGKEGL
jgi:hypothetical protein